MPSNVDLGIVLEALAVTFLLWKHVRPMPRWWLRAVAGVASAYTVLVMLALLPCPPCHETTRAPVTEAAWLIVACLVVELVVSPRRDPPVCRAIARVRGHGRSQAPSASRGELHSPRE